MDNLSQVKKTLIIAAKIAVGSSLAMGIANLLHLEYATSSGIITLLTILATKWETLRLSVFRIITFVLAVLVSWLMFMNIQNEWVAYGFFIFIMAGLLEWFGMRVTLSVNAVVGSHLLMTRNFTLAFIANEFLLVIIGITLAILLNLFQNNTRQREKIVVEMRCVEKNFKRVFEKLAFYLKNEPLEGNVWEDIIALDQRLVTSVALAHEYQDNTFSSHPQYYIDYFEMRAKQCDVLHNLHYEMKKIRKMPQRAGIIADFMNYLKDYVGETSYPTHRVAILKQLIDNMKKEAMPQGWDEFEGEAMVYHILMDLQDFFVYKMRFIDALSAKQREIYWKEGIKPTHYNQ